MDSSNASDVSNGKDCKRGKNFKESEINVLLDLVKEKKHILECKKTDHVTLKEKDAVWIHVEKQFNQVSGLYHRDWKTLKVKYDNIKKATKKKLAEDKIYVFGTGGGPYLPPPIMTETDQKVKDIIGNLPVYGMPSNYDCDSDVGLQVPKNEGLLAFNLTEMPVVCEEEVGFDQDLEPESSRPSTFTYDSEENKCLGVPVEIKSSVETNMITPHRPKPSSNCSSKRLPFAQPRRVIATNSPKTHGTDIKDSELPKPDGFGKDFSLSQLRSQRSSPLFIRKKKRTILDSSRVGQKIEQVSKVKEEVLELQKSVYTEQLRLQKEEHDIRMAMLGEEHEKKMRLLDLKIKSEELEIERKSRQCK